MLINWKVFDDNTSTGEALCEFVYEKKSLNYFFNSCWPEECKREINKMKKLGVKKARSRARRAVKRFGW